MLEDGKLVGKMSERLTPARHGDSESIHPRDARHSSSGIYRHVDSGGCLHRLADMRKEGRDRPLTTGGDAKFPLSMSQSDPELFGWLRTGSTKDFAAP